MFVIEVPYFNLDKIYESYQAPRWIKLKESKYVIPHRDKALKIEQEKLFNKETAALALNLPVRVDTYRKSMNS